MIFRDYNDYEIISLAQQGSEEAIQLMVDKYRYLIVKKIGQFNLVSEFDDCFQESLMILHKSILRFQESFQKTFTRYFEQNLEHCLISLLRKKNRYLRFLSDKLPLLSQNQLFEQPTQYVSEKEIRSSLESLSHFEKLVFHMVHLEQKDIVFTAETLACNPKKVYNATDRIRRKLKMHLE